MSDDNVAIVSGAARGMGKSFAERLSAEGYRVVAFDTDETVLKNKAVHGLVADVSEVDQVEAVVREASKLGVIKVVVNNAGTWRRTPVESPWEQAISDWDYIMDTNLRGVLMLSRASIAHMKAAGGDIINVSSYYVLPAKSAGTNPPDTDLYNASKWALNGFTDAWAKYLDEYGIRVNGMCMGAVDTPMLRGLYSDNKLPDEMAAVVMNADDISQQLIEIIDSGRTGENFGAWVGEQISLGDRLPLHRRITG